MLFEEARGERLKAKSTPQREHDATAVGMVGGWWALLFSLRGFLSLDASIYKTGKRKFDRTLLSDSRQYMNFYIDFI